MKQALKALRSSLAALVVGLAPAIATAEEKPAQETFFFVQHAPSASLDDGTLTLHDADENMIVFADRPHRLAVAVPSSELIKIWGKGQNSFAEDPPNAALVGQSAGQPVSIIVELTNPKRKDGNLVFDYTVLEGTEVQSIEQSYLVIDDNPFAEFYKTMADLAAVSTGDAGQSTQLNGDVGMGILSQGVSSN